MNEDKTLEQISENEMFELMKTLIVKAGKETLTYFGKTDLNFTTKKHAADLLTEADLASNTTLIDGIKEIYPGHGIISEEEPVQDDKKKYVWIIDPLDGTNNFKNSIPIYSVIVGLAKQNQNKELEMIAGAVYIPALNELYQASMGNGAFLNDKRIVCSPKED